MSGASDPDWLVKARRDLSNAARSAHTVHETAPCRACEEAVTSVARVFARETEAAYQRGLMAGRSQARYPTRRKKKEGPCPTSPSAPTADESSASAPEDGP
jgi:hypothetical protein